MRGGRGASPLPGPALRARARSKVGCARVPPRAPLPSREARPYFLLDAPPRPLPHPPALGAAARTRAGSRAGAQLRGAVAFCTSSSLLSLSPAAHKAGPAQGPAAAASRACTHRLSPGHPLSSIHPSIHRLTVQGAGPRGAVFPKAPPVIAPARASEHLHWELGRRSRGRRRSLQRFCKRKKTLSPG